MILLSSRILLWPAFFFLACRRDSAFHVNLSSKTEKTRTARTSLQRSKAGTHTEEGVRRTLEEHQSRAAPIVASFQPRKFDPVPWLSNQHVQTIFSAFVRDIPECCHVLPGDEHKLIPTIGSRLWERFVSNSLPPMPFWDNRERIDTPDGDWFHVDYKYAPKNETMNSHGLVIVLHGLEANSETLLSKDLGRAYQQLGMDVACINFRGCSGVPNNRLGGYHLGFTEDLLLFLNIVKSRYNKRNIDCPPIYLSGYSLGGNVIVKALGDLEATAIQDYNIRGAALLCVPMDAERNAPFLGRPGFNQLVYCKNLLRSLRRRGQDQLDRFCDGNVDTTMFDFQGVMSAKTISEFDAAFVAPIYGFEDEIDYYRNVSSVHYMESIVVPTIILNAEDDPFMDPTYFPTEKSCECGGKAPLKMVLTKHGGHVGFTFHRTSEDIQASEAEPPSWASAELARFIKHVSTHSL